MKKLLALLLALTMVLSLAACGGSTTPAAATTAEAPATTAEAAPATTAEAAPAATPAEPAAPAFTWNGQKEVWAVVPTTNAEGLMVICNTMGETMTAQGWTYVAKDAALDPGKQVSFVEDAIASKKVGALMVPAMSVEMLKDIVEKATAAGIAVGYLGALPADYTINTAIYTAYEITGMFAIEMAEAWAKANNPAKDAAKGKIPVALDVYDDIQDGQYRSNAFRDRTEESEILFNYNTNVSYGKDAQTKGYTWAENQMTANPDLRIFICYEPDCMVGVTQFLAKYAKEKKIDLKEFCVINCYEDTATKEEFAKAKADASSTAFKGYVTYGASPQDTGKKLGELMLGSADGSWKFGEVYYDSVYSNATFAFEKTWKMGEENPAIKYKY